MAGRHYGLALRHMNDAYRTGSAAGLSEAQLLERFARGGHEAAFEAIVARHGPMVLGVCRRALRDPGDAEDAFQAVFLVLARRADSLRDRDRLAPWLHGVARRVASRARGTTLARRAREQAVGAIEAEAPEPDPDLAEVRATIDEEVGRLPERWRLPVVLCHLQGRSYEEAAQELRCTVGTVRGRLARARERLRLRLIRRGLAPLAVASLVDSSLGAPAPPPALVAATVRSATLIATSVTGLGLASRALRLGGAGRWRPIVAGVAALGLAAVGLLAAARGVRSGPAEEPPKIVQAPAQVPQVEKLAPRPARRKAGRDDATVYEVTIEGRATDAEGRPAAGANILVTDANGQGTRGVGPVLGRAVAGGDGRFAIRDMPLPVFPATDGAIPRPAEGRFEVGAWAEGLAFSWNPPGAFRPDIGDAALRAREPIRTDIILGPPASVRGRVIDDRGRPIAGAKVQVGAVDDPRRPVGGGSWQCARLDADGNFSGVRFLPESRRMARTDADGRYEIAGLPRDSTLGMLIDHDPSFEPRQLTIATTDRPVEGAESLGAAGEVDHTFATPRAVRVRVTTERTGGPVSGARVTAHHDRRMQRAGAVASTDAEGAADLRLLPGAYALRVEPAIGSADLAAEPPLVVPEALADATVIAAVTLPSGATIAFEAVEEGSGAPIAGVGFEVVTGTDRDRRQVQTHPAYVDHPTTDPAGRLRVTLPPGRARFFPGRVPPGLEAVAAPGPMIELRPGEVASARLTFRAEARPSDANTPADPVVARLVKLWEGQSAALDKGFLRGRRAYQPGDGLDPDDLRRLLDSLDPRRAPALPDLIRDRFPDAGAPSEGILEVTVSGAKRREDWPDATRDEGSPWRKFSIANGKETTSFEPANAQVNIMGGKGGMSLGVSSIRDFCALPRPDGMAATKITRDRGRVAIERTSGPSVERIEADEASGFVYRWSRRYADRGDAYERWQFAPRAVGKGVVMPALAADFEAHQGRVNALWIRTVETVDLDAEVRPEAFLAAVPAGAMILDYREGRDDAYRGVLREAVADVVARADRIAQGRKPFVSPAAIGRMAPALAPASWVDKAGEAAAPDLSGKVILLVFWSTGCGPCVAELPEVREAFAHFAGTDLAVVGLHEGGASAADLAAFLGKRSVDFPVAIDRAAEDGFGATFEAFGVRSIPAAAVIDRRGHLVAVSRFREALEKAAEVAKRAAD